jgi:hypothetical protein
VRSESSLDRFAVLAALTLALALQAFFFQRGLYSISWDEAGRTLDAWAWVNHGTTVGDWLPLHRVLVGSALRLDPDLVITPRIVSGLFGLGAILAVGWLAHQLFRNRLTTTVALFLAAAFSQRVVLSLTPLSCIVFAPFIVASLAAFVSWLRSDRWAALVLSLGFLAAAQTLRFEGWVFAAFLVVTVFLHRYSASSSLMRALTWSSAVALALSIVPLAWALDRVVDGIGLLGPVSTVRGETPPDVINPIVQFVVRNARSLNLIGLVAFGFLLRGREQRFIALFAFAGFGPLIALSSALYLAGAGPTGPSWRITTVWGLLFLPFTAALLTRAWRTAALSTNERRVSNAATALLAALFVFDAERTRRETASWAFPPADRELGAVIEDFVRRKPNTRVLIESGAFDYLNVLVASQHPHAFVANAGPPTAPGTPILEREPGLTASVCDKGFDILVFHSEGDWRWLDGRSEARAIGRFGNWAAYFCEERT